MKNLHYYLGFSYCLGIGPITFDLLLKHFGSIEKAYKADEMELKELLGQVLGQKFIVFRDEFNAGKELEQIHKNGVTVVTRESERFPPQLKTLSDPPICLYVKGDLKELNFEKDYFFSVVGTRTPTSYGQFVAKKITTELARAGFIIVSGMAMGIDSVAHQSALQEGVKTVAVLGCGVNIVYPRINEELYEKIIKSGGLILSEFPPEMEVRKGMFIARNRLISGLSKGVLVVEGAKDSGALITAKYAAEQGKEVFALPAPITSQMSEAPNFLIKEGAKLVTSVDDILNELSVRSFPIKQKKLEDNFSQDEKLIVGLLKTEVRLADELSLKLRLPIDLILQTISSLEIKGIIEKNTEGKYQLK